MKGLAQHTPTDEDISNILKDFTVDFLLKGYGFLVQELYSKLLSDLELVSKKKIFKRKINVPNRFYLKISFAASSNRYVTFFLVGYILFEIRGAA